MEFGGRMGSGRAGAAPRCPVGRGRAEPAGRAVGTRGPAPRMGLRRWRAWGHSEVGLVVVLGV